MATKANIQTQINTIDDGGLNTAQEVREVFGTNADSLLEEFYKTSTISDNETTTNVFTSSLVNLDYNFLIKKQGGKVTINGQIINRTSSLLNDNTTLMEITNAEYDNSELVNFFGQSSVDGTNIRLRLKANGEIENLSTIGVSESAYFELTYFIGQ